MIVRILKRYAGPAIGAAGLAFLLLFVSEISDKANRQNPTGIMSGIAQYAGDVFENSMQKKFMPIWSFVESDYSNVLQYAMKNQLEQIFFLSAYESRANSKEGFPESKMTMEMILMAEGEEEHTTDDFSQEGVLWEDQLEWEALLQAENAAAIAKNQGEEGTLQMENTPQLQEKDLHTENGFIPHQTKLASVDMVALQNYETLVSQFYTIDKSTMIGSDQLNIEEFTALDMTISKEDEGPQILIYHTHSQEGFADSVEGDASTTIVGVGERLARILTDQYGYEVLHHTEAYDVPSRDDAYSVALPEIEKLLTENPQIQVVIDLHRDAMDESTRLVTEVDGRPTAKFMFFNGVSRTRKTGNIAYLYNENLDSNLAFSFQMQKTALEYYPGLTRKIYLKAYRYNMHLRPRTLLVELGAQNNTVEEAMNACDPLAHILDMVLSGQE